MTPYDIAVTAAKALDSKLGIDIKVLKVEEITVLADYFVICSGGSNTQVKALADEVEFRLEQEEVRPNHVEGRGDGSWTLLDYGSVMVHVFTEEGRSFYSLERLWADAEEIAVDF